MSIRVSILFSASFVLLLFCGCYDFSHERSSGRHPVKEVELTRLNGRPYELFVHTVKDVRLDSLVDISFFDGLDRDTSLEAAKRMLGEPHHVRTQPDMKLSVYLYFEGGSSVSFAIVFLCRAAGAWDGY